MVLAKQRAKERDETVQMQSIRGGEVGVEYTNKPLSGWGGLVLFYEFGAKVGLFETLEKILPDKKTSPNRISSVDIVKGLMATVLTGGNRFAHVERMRGDEVIRTALGAERVGGADTIRRYFESLTRSENEQIYDGARELTGQLLIRRRTEDILDLDSTGLARYGHQEGVSQSYQKGRSGRVSQDPLLGMLAKSKHIAHMWLRQGGSSTLRGPADFLKELLAGLPDGFKITLVRADSGFHSENFIKQLEAEGLPYIVAVRMHQPFKRLAAAIPKERWKRRDQVHEVADEIVEQPLWDKPRRVLFMRHITEVKGQLFDTESYEFHALVTSLTNDALECCDTYDSRAECENTIKEYKSDFGAQGFCLRQFYATEMVLRLIAALFNLCSAFKHDVLRDTSVTLATVRTKVFVVGAMLGRCGRKVILRLGLVRRWKDSFQTLLARASPPTLSTAAQSSLPT